MTSRPFKGQGFRNNSNKTFLSNKKTFSIIDGRGVDNCQKFVKISFMNDFFLKLCLLMALTKIIHGVYNT
jgi:hypothetical protein